MEHVGADQLFAVYNRRAPISQVGDPRRDERKRWVMLVTQAVEHEGAATLGGLLPALVAELPAVLDDVSRMLEGSWPGYADFLTRERSSVTAAGQDALRRIVDTACRTLRGLPPRERPEEPDDELAVFEEVGRAEWRAGTGLTTLLTAYGAAAAAGWRRMAATAVEHGVSADAMAQLAEAVFVLVDQLSAASARGYVQEQERSAAERERARGDLVELLLSDRSDERLVTATADRARWHLPATAALVVVDPDDQVAARALPRLPGAWLSVRRPGLVGAIVPDPGGPGQRARLTQALRGVEAVVGPTVALPRLPAVTRFTQVAARLQREGALTARPLFVDEHLDAIIVHNDSKLLEALAQRVLEPLATLPKDTQLRLEETLTSWLRHLGDQTAVAAELHIHRQTVRYRMGQLREAFDGRLDDPETRLQLLLVLGWRSPAAAPAGIPQQGRHRP
jgi:hypothetical protein